MKATRNSTKIAVAAIITDVNNRIAISEIKVDPYLDAIEIEFQGFKELGWWDKFRKIYNLGEIGFDFYEDFIDETQEDQKKALKDIGYAGWEYLRDTFNISLPYVGPFQDSIVTRIIEMGVNSAYDRLARQYNNTEG